MAIEIPEWVFEARKKWRYRGLEKPSFALEPGPGQESVWDYPRPPRLEKEHRQIIIRANGKVVAESRSTYRALETASPPTFYIPSHDIDQTTLIAGPQTSLCEWKGLANYWHVRGNDLIVENGAWSYVDPYPEFENIAGHFAFYPHRLACYVDGELVRPQPGLLYGGWITKNLVGPFKGEPGTENW